MLGLAERHLADGALERAHEPGYPRDVAKLLADNGLMGITIREEDGGLGGTLMDAVIAIQQVAQACPRSADVVQSGNFGRSAHSRNMRARSSRRNTCPRC